MGNIWRLNDLTFYSRSFIFYLFYFIFVVVYKHVLKKRTLFLVFERLFVLSESKFFLFLFLSPLISVYQFFHLLIKLFLLLSRYYAAHFVSFVFVQENRLEILPVLRLIFTAEIMFQFLKLLVEISEVSQFWNLLLIDVFCPDVMIIIFELLDSVLVRYNSQGLGLLWVLRRHRHRFHPFIYHCTVFG